MSNGGIPNGDFFILILPDTTPENANAQSALMQQWLATLWQYGYRSVNTNFTWVMVARTGAGEPPPPPWWESLKAGDKVKTWKERTAIYRDFGQTVFPRPGEWFSSGKVFDVYAGPHGMTHEHGFVCVYHGAFTLWVEGIDVQRA